MIKEILTTILLSGSLAFGGVSQEIQSPKMVNYDDSNYQITLESSEVNNYTFENFVDYLGDNHLNDISFTYGDLNFTYYETGSISYGYANNYLILRIYFSYSSAFELNKGNMIFVYGSTPLKSFYSLKINCNSNNYATIKGLIENDINNNLPTISLYGQVYGYFHDVVFKSESLDDYQTEFFGVNTSIRTWLSHTASLVSIVSVVILFISFIIMLVKMIGALFYNFGR